jgi:hypothetical protein
MSCASAGQSPCRRSRWSSWPARAAHRCSGRIEGAPASRFLTSLTPCRGLVAARRGSLFQSLTWELDIFEQTSDYSELRFSYREELRTRGLDRKAIDDLIEVVDRAYAEDSVAQRVFGSAQLRDLGEKLYHFLDGDERWLSAASADPRGVALRISAEERLRHLPWELVVRDGSYLAVSERTPLLPIRVSSSIATLAGEVKPHNRPLRVLFMAASPEGVEPVLSYEAEEGAILAATADTGTELVVEESGTLEGLRFTAESYGVGFFDVLHLSGHATVHEGQPKFLLENELGGLVLATADQIAQAMVGQWPRMVFVSGCLTGSAPDGGTILSMSESLVKAGAPVVLGWALPVGDVSATEFASRLYRALAAGQPVDRSVVSARQQLYILHSRNWHLLRMYADQSPLTPMVTALHTPGRERIRVRHAADEFLDPQTQISRVASRANFVGRRRVIQRCLRTLKQPFDSPGAAEALMLQGMGGLGKSTLASRLLERMPTHQRAVWFGRVDLTKFRELTSKVTFQSLDQQMEAATLLAKDEVDLAVRLRYLFSGPFGQIPCLFVFDDFEQGNLEERHGGYVLSNEMAQILPALLNAIDETNSPSRVIITSRYQFPVPAGATLQVEALETLTDVEQAKKVANLPNLRPESVTTPTVIRDRAIEAASGNPRLLDWLDRIVADTSIDVDGLIAAIENEADKFRRKNIFAENFSARRRSSCRRCWPSSTSSSYPCLPRPSTPSTTTQAASHVKRAAQLGLLEKAPTPRPTSCGTSFPTFCGPDQTTDHRRRVQPGLRCRSPIAVRDLGDCGAARRHGLIAVTSVVRWVEVHRLAVAGREAGIAREVGDRIGRVWLARSRFVDVVRLAEQTLTLGEDAGAFYDLGWAKRATGFPVEALAAYEQALRRYRADPDRGNEAATRTSIGLVYDVWGTAGGPWSTTSRPCPSCGRSGTGPVRPPR